LLSERPPHSTLALLLRRLADTYGFIALALLCCVMLVYSTFLVLFVAPVEEVMGYVQKIFYFHVPSAMAMYAGVALCSGASLVFLLTRRPQFDALGRVGAELATLACVIVLITGPIWAWSAWGAAWVWDPRLTGVAVLGLILGSYHLVRVVGDESGPARRLAAVLGVLAAPNGYLIHMAVRMWGGQHPTVIYASGGLDPIMRDVFEVCIQTAMLLLLLLAWLRYDFELTRLRAKELATQILLKESRDEP
jgi:heme exporter protein C